MANRGVAAGKSRIAKLAIASAVCLIFIALTFFLSQGSSADAEKETFESDGVLYERDGGNAIVIGWTENLPEDLKIPSWIKHGGRTLYVNSVANAAFANCEKLNSVTIPSSVKTIGESAFFSCKSMVSVNMSEGLEKIGTAAFRHCTSLESVTLPKSVVSAGGSLFRECTSLVSVDFKSVLVSQYDNLLQSRIPYTMREHMFFGCESLDSVKVPEGLKNISTGAFWGCKSLVSLELPSSIFSVNSMSFLGCSSLTFVKLNSTPVIHYTTFYGCPVKSLTISSDNARSNYGSLIKPFGSSLEEVIIDSAYGVKLDTVAGNSQTLKAIVLSEKSTGTLGLDIHDGNGAELAGADRAGKAFVLKDGGWVWDQDYVAKQFSPPKDPQEDEPGNTPGDNGGNELPFIIVAAFAGVLLCAAFIVWKKKTR